MTSLSPVPASFAQQRLWFLDQLESGTAAYNLARAFRIDGSLDVSCLTRAIQAVVCRHESLRTVFESVDGQARQIVLPAVNIEPRLIDLSDIAQQRRDEEALRLAAEEGKKPFDLTQGPLFRTLLIRLDPTQHLLVLAMHHIITDGWSIAILFRELTKCYEAFLRGEEPILPDLPVQYSEFAQWQREYITGEVLEKQVEYWKNRLSGVPTLLELPTDHSRPAIHSWHGATEDFTLDAQAFDGLKRIAQGEGATPFMVSLAAFQALLWRYTMQDSILVGTPVAGRKEIEIENLIGFFVNTLVFRADFNQDLSFRSLVRQIRAFALDAYTHQDVPFERLVEELVPQRSMDTTPLFQVMFTFQNIPKQVFQISGLEMEEVPFETGISKFDLSVDAYEHDGLHFRFEYNTDLFDHATIQRMIRHFQVLVAAAVERPDQAVSQLSLITRDEQQALAAWNRTDADYPRDSAIHTVFETQAHRTPDAVALLCQGSHFTYKQVNEKANRLAHHLMRHGAGAGDLIGVALERSPDLVITLLAILKTGAAYVPLDPTLPPDRLALMVEDSKVWGVVTLQAFTDKLNNANTVIVLDTLESSIGAEPASNPGVAILPGQRAYVIYTSGSTGTPKGVVATHRACLNRFSWMWREYPFAAGEVCCQKTNLGFVDSIWEIFGPLL
ncbi:MAG TPA: condensation domain-containing protein, partial [Terriglobales bacterium]